MATKNFYREEIRVLAVGSDPERLKGIDAPTLKEKGIDVVVTNWRGVSAHPSLTKADLDKLSELFDKMVKSPTQEISAARGCQAFRAPLAIANLN